MYNKYRKLLSSLCLCLVFLSSELFAFTVPPLEGPVNDHAKLLSRKAKRDLEDLLYLLDGRTKAQLAFLSVNDLEGLPIEEASMATVEAWKLGEADSDLGLLFFVAKNERKMRIEVGQGLEGVLPDARAKQIISDHVTPLFRKKNFDQGVLLAFSLILSEIEPELALNPQVKKNLPSRKQGLLSHLFSLFFALFLILLISKSNGRGSFFWILLLSQMASSRGYSSGGSSGFKGFGGGGGGFSGGGASGEW